MQVLNLDMTIPIQKEPLTTSIEEFLSVWLHERNIPVCFLEYFIPIMAEKLKAGGIVMIKR